MKISQQDLDDRSSLTSLLLKQLAEHADNLFAQAHRTSQLYNYLIQAILDGRITDSDDIAAAVAWLNHSKLSAEEIITKLLT